MTDGFTDPWVAPTSERGERTFVLAAATGSEAAGGTAGGDVGVEGSSS
jgi:hypothetical protein